ncbi:hydroxyacylglutathione hydrolase [Legionella donaldsonii]|uniref:Hydroxyacylglutathione hydrolase n=1 Tax=Legionella donaldsonii TaxID=45060 RepID=A0A378J6Z6_9GAMM|nr:hydroxyacylglutathione hydrolase [Legionella donaldsonii]STX42761.1 hydroxyacylglutathione hydrolase [Legionella donaldsonii]
MKILPIPAFNDNYIWLLINEEEQTAICVDPGDANPVLAFLEQEELKLKAILLTHHHYDHTDGVNELINTYPGIAIYGPKDSRIPQVNHILQDGDLLPLPPYHFRVLSTPGHTATHISLYEPEFGLLFCGDTLFSAGCGRVFDGTIEDLFASLQKLKALPDITQIYCAHEYTRRNLRFAATVEPDNLAIRQHAHRLMAKENQRSLPSNIGLEKEINPFFRTHLESMQNYVALKGNKNKDPMSVFKQLRADKDNFS